MQKQLEAINYRLTMLKEEGLRSTGDAEDQAQLTAIKALIESGEELSEEQQEYMFELMFWYSQEVERAGEEDA